MRWLVRVTVVLLALDALLLGTVGVLAARPWFLGGAAVALILLLAVLAFSRRFRAHWEAVAAARADLKAEAGTLARATGPRDNLQPPAS